MTEEERMSSTDVDAVHRMDMNFRCGICKDPLNIPVL